MILEEKPIPPSSSRYYSLLSRGKIDENISANDIFKTTIEKTSTPTRPKNLVTPNTAAFSPPVGLTTFYNTTPSNLDLQFPQPFQYHESSQYKTKSKVKAGKPFCEFCKNNNEDRSVYNSHVLKDMEGRVVCPVRAEFFDV